MIKWLFLILVSASAVAQTNTFPKQETGLESQKPSSCNPPSFFLATDTGNLYACLSGHYGLISGSGSAGGSISVNVSPNAVAFGPWQTGSSTVPEQAITISNTGSSNVAITAINRSGSSNFALTSPTLCLVVLPPGASCTPQIHFSPTTVGAVTATFTVVSSAPVSIDNPLTVTVTGTGSSTPTFLLSLVGAGTGNGNISDGGTLSCNFVAGVATPAPGSVCAQPYIAGSNPVLTATPLSGSTFGLFGGTAGCTTSPCTVNMSQTQTVTGTFTLQTPNRTLNLGATGQGGGSMVSDMSSTTGLMSCNALAGVVSSGGNAGCSGVFQQGNVITITETPNGTSTFIGWSGPCTGSATTCVITLNSDVTLTANFAPTSTPLSLVQTATNCSVVTNTIACTWANAMNAGDTVMCVGAWPDATSTVSSIADTKTNTYTQFPTISPKVGTGITQAGYYASNIIASTAGANTTTMTLSSSVGAAVAFSAPIVGNSSSAGTAAYTTASLTPVANNPVIVVAVARLATGNGPGALTSVAGDGLTWAQLVSGVDFSSAIGTGKAARLEVWCGVGASPTTGGLTITWPQAVTKASWSVIQTANAVATCAGMKGITASAFSDIGTASPLTVTMGTFGSSANATMGIGALDVSGVGFNAGSGFTDLDGVGANPPSLEIEYATTNVSPVTETYTSGGPFKWALIGIEIKASGANTRRDMRCLEYAGIKTSGSPIDQSVAAVGTGTAVATGTITTTTAQDLLLGFTASLNSVSAADTTHNWVQRLKNTFGDDVEDQQGVAVGTYNLQPTLTSSANWVAMNVGFLTGSGGVANNFSLTITGAGAGAGLITGNAGTPQPNCTINAGARSGACSASVSSGSSVTLTAAPLSGSAFSGWTGVNGCGSSATCIVPNITSGQNITANFSLSGVQQYYVGGTGASDSNNGLCPATGSSCNGGPWATIGKAAATTLVIGASGTTVNVVAGTYNESVHGCNAWNAALCWTQSGTSVSRPIILLCTAQWSQPSSTGCLIRNSGAATGITVIANNVTVGGFPHFGFDLTGANYVSGIQIEGNCTSGTCATGNNVHLYGNYLHDVSQTVNDGSPNAQVGCPSSAAIQAGHGDTITGFQAIGNLISNIGDQTKGRRLGGTCNQDHGIYANTPNPIIQNNVLQDIVAYGIHVYHNDCGGIISNNTVVRVGASGILVAGGGSTPLCTTPGVVTITNNIVDISAQWGIQLGTGGSTPNCDSTHQIFVGSNIGSGNPSGGIGQANSCVITSNSISEAPATTFTTYNGNNTDNYQLKAGSLAINGGTQNGVLNGTGPFVPSFDFLNVARPQRTSWDIGAYELP